MSYEHWSVLGNVAFYVATIVMILFVLLYGLLSPWWRSIAGRNIMAVMGSMALAFGYFSWVIASGGVPAGFHPMRAIIFISIASAVSWRLMIFINHHLLGRREGNGNGTNDLGAERQDAGHAGRHARDGRSGDVPRDQR